MRLLLGALLLAVGRFHREETRQPAVYLKRRVNLELALARLLEHEAARRATKRVGMAAAWQGAEPRQRLRAQPCRRRARPTREIFCARTISRASHARSAPKSLPAPAPRNRSGWRGACSAAEKRRFAEPRRPARQRRLVARQPAASSGGGAQRRLRHAPMARASRRGGGAASRCRDPPTVAVNRG